jgi:hypothetical protein
MDEKPSALKPLASSLGAALLEIAGVDCLPRVSGGRNAPPTRGLNYDLEQLCSRNREGSAATQADRARMLELFAHQLEEMGFRYMNARSLEAKHVKKLIERWLAEGLCAGTLKNRMTVVRWWACKIGKEHIVAASNAVYGIPDRLPEERK